jgi:subtilisin family serine protease
MAIVRVSGVQGLSAPSADSPPFEPSPALSVLAQFEEAGKVLAVVPLTPAAPTLIEPSGAVAALMAPSLDADEGATSIIRLSRDDDVPQLLQALADAPEVQFASRVPTRWTAVAMPASRALFGFGGPGMAGAPTGVATATQLPWNLQRIGWDRLQSMAATMADDVRVGVLDTGVDPYHPNLAGQVDRYVWDGPSVTGHVSSLDIVGHGTHVSGTICALPGSTPATRGVCRARLSVWKIFDDEPDYIAGSNIYWYLVDPIMYRRALAQCAESVDIVNLSIGGAAPPDPQERALLDVLASRGITVVAAMGNERSLGSPTSYPAAIPGVIAVGATAVDDTVAPFSNAGDYIQVSAPGVGIWSTMPHYPGQPGFRVATGPGGKPMPGTPIPREINYATESGTSMATPHVAAAAALALSNSSSRRRPTEVRDIIMASADHTPGMLGQVWTRDVGAGRVNLPRLIMASRNL